MMSSAFRIGSQRIETRKAKAEDDQKIQKYIDLAEILENQLLSGGLAFSTPEPDPRRDILFQATQDVTLEIPIVSSMVKELAPLVLYLRYLAEPGELLIIDEPEMNLHPEMSQSILLPIKKLRAFDETHNAFMTLPPYTHVRKGKVRQWGHGSKPFPTGSLREEMPCR